jgi:hypothetical protein
MSLLSQRSSYFLPQPPPLAIFMWKGHDSLLQFIDCLQEMVWARDWEDQAGHCIQEFPFWPGFCDTFILRFFGVDLLHK